jgi:hypothetical protein
MDLKQLAEPFPPSDIEWRIGRAGNKDGKVWATCLAYITNRAIMERLDEVCGPDNWRNEYKTLPIGANDSTVLCGISIKVGDEWVTKWDGSGAMESNAGLIPRVGGWLLTYRSSRVSWNQSCCGGHRWRELLVRMP